MDLVIRGDGGRKKQRDTILWMIESACQILIRYSPRRSLTCRRRDRTDSPGDSQGVQLRWSVVMKSLVSK